VAYSKIYLKINKDNPFTVVVLILVVLFFLVGRGFLVGLVFFDFLVVVLSVVLGPLL